MTKPQIVTSPLPFDVVSAVRKTFLVTITPAMATWILENCGTHNRPLKFGVAESYGDDMKAHRWQVTNQGLAFSKDGLLIDGQHRCWGCVDSQTPFDTLVTVGLELETRDVIDTGLRRSEGDVLMMRTGNKVANLYVSTGRMMSASTRHHNWHKRLPRAEFLNYLQKHHDAIEFAIAGWRNGEGGGNVRFVTVAPVLAVVARAWYLTERVELCRFMRILTSGMPEGSYYQPVLMLRNWLIQMGVHNQVERYQKTQTALHAFLTHKPIRHRLYASADELFPMDEER